MSTTTDLAPHPIGVQIIRVAPDAPEDDIIRAIMFLGRLTDLLKEAKAAIEGDAKAWIKANHALTIGEMFYWVGDEKKPPKCADVAGASEALLGAVGGDWEAFCRHLASGAIKYGAFRETMGETVFEKFFKQETTRELQSAPVDKKLRKMPVAMMEGR